MLRTSELVSIVYFLSLAALAWRESAPRSARLRTSVAAAAVAGAVLLASSADAVVRDWLPALLLPLSYWLPAALVSRPLVPFERWLMAWDDRFFASAPGRAIGRAPRPVREVFELAYLAVYPMVPAAFAVLLGAGLRADADRFWTTVLAAEYSCYILLPLVPTRPPRAIEKGSSHRGRDALGRRINLAVLGRASNQWNTFPSGHVAGAVACALAMLPVLPGAGIALLALAGLIAVGSIAGRYHYLADAAAGAAVACAAAALFAL